MSVEITSVRYWQIKCSRCTDGSYTAYGSRRAAEENVERHIANHDENERLRAMTPDELDTWLTERERSLGALPAPSPWPQGPSRHFDPDDPAAIAPPPN